MPTRTFFNLPEEKQRRLLHAVREEFSRASFDKVSINQIVREACVSRGSFYQYFDSKEDVLQYMLSGYRQKVVARARQSLEDSDGDLFAMFYEAMDYTVDFASEDISRAFCRNLFSDQGLVNRLFNWQGADHAGGTLARVLEEIRPLIDTQRLAVDTADDLAQMFSVLWLVTGDALARTFFDTSRREQVRRQYIRRLDMIKSGFAR